MLILPPGHAQAVRVRRRLTARERWIVRLVAVAVAAVIVVVVISFATSAGPRSSNGCIHVTVPGPVGAQAFSQCGATARSTCASALTSGAFTLEAARTVAAECRKAHLPVGR